MSESYDNPDYKKEGEVLIDQHIENCKKIHDELHKENCLFQAEMNRAMVVENKRFSTELKALKKKYGVEDHSGKE